MFKHRLTKFGISSFIAMFMLFVGGSLQSCQDWFDVYPYDDPGDPEWLGASVYDFLKNGTADHSYANYIAIIDSLGVFPVLLLEDIGERHYHVERMLHNLRLSGVFSRVKAVIIGQFTDCDDDPRMPFSLQKTIEQVIGEAGCPVFFGLPYGHDEVNVPVKLGGVVKG